MKTSQNFTTDSGAFFPTTGLSAARLAVCQANERLLDICLENSWSFYVGFKEGSIPILYRQMLKTMGKHPGQVVTGEDNVENYVCRWACNLTHKRHRLHAVMCDLKAKKDGKQTRFVFLTDHRLDSKTGLHAFKSLKALAKSIGKYLRHACVAWETLDRKSAQRIQLRFVFDTS